MRLRWLGWAGVEVERDGQTIVIDPLLEPGAVFAPLGNGAGELSVPEVVPAAGAGACAGLVTHLHRDHTDAGALAAALAPGAVVYGPPAPPDSAGQLENLGLAQALAELDGAGIEPHPTAPWSSADAGDFSLTALPAADGLGDPQVSWLIEAGGKRLLHLGDTVFHGGLWRIAQRYGPLDAVLVPINGAVVDFPHRQPASPLPVVLDPEQAALAAALLGARVAVPIHHGGYDNRWYRPTGEALERFLRAAHERGLQARPLELGGQLEL